MLKIEMDSAVGKLYFVVVRHSDYLRIRLDNNLRICRYRNLKGEIKPLRCSHDIEQLKTKAMVFVSYIEFISKLDRESFAV